jgi:hypothetical protein
VLVVLAGLALAGMDPGLEPADVQGQYRAFAEKKGRKGAETELVCRPFAEAIVLCFSSSDGKKRVYATAAGGKDAATLEAESRGTAEAALACLEPVQIEGLTRRYLACSRGDGRDHVPMLFPQELAEKLGGVAVVAVPARGVLVAWSPGDLDVDKAVAVGVRRMYEALPDPVSPLVYRWNGTSWVTWGEAREVAPPPAGAGG